ncbi:hypothetical protein E2C01_070877 [Portunus trituberculatus]|uniref:Uncharacterized protein n=1 Tax=Portunus trituberculatus TaxID=210409 RepID=A0A5B7I6M4_PORTR|nr:hypothetical protein [Portunus trituberculatus]
MACGRKALTEQPGSERASATYEYTQVECSAMCENILITVARVYNERQHHSGVQGAVPRLGGSGV